MISTPTESENSAAAIQEVFLRRAFRKIILRAKKPESGLGGRTHKDGRLVHGYRRQRLGPMIHFLEDIVVISCDEGYAYHGCSHS